MIALAVGALPVRTVGQAPAGQSAARATPWPEVPFVAGMSYVLAVHNPTAAPAGSRIAQGDYEMVVTVGEIAPDHITLKTRIEAEDERKQPLLLDIARREPAADLKDARLQILGFHTNDGPALPGTTALGPSLAVMRDLQTTGRASYSVRNFNHLSTSSGTLTRTSATPVPFSVLLNGRRVDLPAIRVTGQLTYNGNVRPWEFYLLDHPQHPLTLRFAVGGIGASFPFTPETTREIVRIDYPSTEPGWEGELTSDCRAEVPGIYFDFNRATITPQSAATLAQVAALFRRQAGWTVTIEGHTDNVGTDAYNQDLSGRRAAAVKEALVRDYAVAASRLTTAGFGEQRPRETNETIAGRARNRRVEMVRDCGKGR